MAEQPAIRMDEQLWSMPAVDLARVIRTRDISCEEVANTYLARIAEVNPKINAIVQIDPAEVVRQARQADTALRDCGNVGPFHGVPITVKDTFEVRGVISSAGAVGRRGFRPEADATVVSRLRRAGAIVLGKTNVPELALAVETDNLVYGTTRNPYDLARTPGGSSGGPAAAVAAGLSALDIGSDCGGSIRIPAHYCGIAALKATTGRIPATGHFPEAWGPGARLGGYGPLARSARDIELALSVLEGEDFQDPLTIPLDYLRETVPQLPALRVAYFTDNGVRAPLPAVTETVEQAARALAGAGCAIKRASPPDLADGHELLLAFVINDRHQLAEWLKEAASDTVHPWVTAGLAYLEDAAADLEPNFAALLFYECARFQRKALAFMRDYDIVLSPAASFPAPVLGDGVRGESFSGYSYAHIYNVLGWPATVVRCGTSSEGLPIGVQIAARPFGDRLTITAAIYLEKALGGWQAPAAV
jgi:amidase